MTGINLKSIKNKSVLEHDNKRESLDIFSFFKKDIHLFSTKLKDRDKEMMYLELSNMLNSGVDLRSSLEVIISNIHKNHKELLKRIVHEIIYGSSFYESVKREKNFTPYEYHTIQIGEETGQLGDVLKELSLFYKKRIKQKRMLISAISYPIVILMTSIAAVSFMLYFIVPMFSEIFKRFGGDLPYITQMIINFSSFLTSRLYLFIGIFVAISIFVLSYRKDKWFRKYKDLVIYNCPYVGLLLHKIQLAQFSSSMALLLGAKIPLLRSIELIGEMIDYYPIKSSLNTIEEDILQGLSLNESLSRFKYFDGKMVALIKVGEEVNKLNEFLKI